MSGSVPVPGITSLTGNGQRTAGIDAHEPVSFASCLGGMIEIVVTASRLEVGESLTNGFIGEGGNPQAVERLMAV